MSLPITANIATYPAREKSLKVMLNSIDGQFDKVRVCLNGYTQPPSWLPDWVDWRIPTNDLADNGKLWALDFITSHEIFCTLDDDIIYPKDYARFMAKGVEDYEAIVTLHGRYMVKPSSKYYGQHRHYFHCFETVKEPAYLNCPGTGVMAFNTSYFKPSNISTDPRLKMVDLVFAEKAAEAAKKIVLLPHRGNYIQPIATKSSIYKQESMGNQSAQVAAANRVIELTISKKEVE